VIRFGHLESAGLSIAAMSEIADGDCRLPSEFHGFVGEEGRRAFLATLGAAAEKLVCVRQVHGANVLVADEMHAGQGGLSADSAPGEYDAIVTQTHGLPIGISVADCVPLMVYDPGKQVAAVAHAGRLGTKANIAGNTVAAMQTRFGCSPGDLLAEIGPSAGPDRYEVSEEMATEFEALDLPREGRLLDLWGANRVQLERAGLDPARIRTTGHCTISSDRYFSHRRQNTLARNLAIVMI
jgi:polyphenol oxidase